MKNVISLFNGYGSIWIALDKMGVSVENKYISEIDKYANIVNNDNFPECIQLGNAIDIDTTLLTDIDLLVGGSPCQGFSQAGKKLDFDDPRSKLFFEFVRIKKATNPKYFLYENVVPKNKEVIKIISEYLECDPISIDSSLFSAAGRKRLYWTNIKGITIPKDKGVLLKDIVGFESDIPEIGETIEEIKRFTKREFNVSISKKGRVRPHRLDIKKSGISEVGTLTNPNDKCVTIIASHAPKTYKTNPFQIYELNRNECEVLQNIPKNFTKSVSFSQAKKMIGNGWTVDLIAHVISFIN